MFSFPNAEVIRAVLADDHVMVRQALGQILDDSGAIRVVGQVGDGQEIAAMVAAKRPDVLVMDYTMPNFSPTNMLESLLREHPQLKILVLTVHENIHYAVQVLEAGAHGYVVKSGAVNELLEAIRAVRAGEVYISPKVSQKVLQTLKKPKKDRAGLDALSTREFELLRVLGAGMGLTECAEFLNISVSAASTYRARLIEKLNLRSTAEVIRFALENDIVG